ncbi:MAG: tRNA pseudouridine(55) synthase TruB [Oscillospiraceae bacterium]
MNGIIVVDKPEGWTSQDVCSKLRGVLHERRIGHSGTLDPMATGVLTVFCGRATRAAEFAENDEKRYIAGLRLGITTDTQDITGNILESRECSVSEEQLLTVLRSFTGELQQLPPMYSAVKIGGKKLYELARRGETVERKPRRIVIKHLELTGRDNGDFILDITCSKGTYIRTLCSDIGAAMGCGGAMSSLRRVAAGAFSLSDSYTMDEITSASDSGHIHELMLPVDSLFSSFPAAEVDELQEKKCRNGNEFKATLPVSGRYRVYSQDGTFLMLGEYSGGIMKTVKSFFEV